MNNISSKSALLLDMRNHSGVTLIELVMVILLIGILAVYAAPKFDISIFRNNNFFLQATSSIRYAQKQAIASGCNIEVNINAAGCNLQWSNPSATASCPTDTTVINSPSNGSTNFCNNSTPAGSPTGGNFRFDSIGRPMDTSNTLLTTALSIVIGTRTILVEAETGYTHEN